MRVDRECKSTLRRGAAVDMPYRRGLPRREMGRVRLQRKGDKCLVFIGIGSAIITKFGSKLLLPDLVLRVACARMSQLFWR